jgi:hypothetical protein
MSVLEAFEPWNATAVIPPGFLKVSKPAAVGVLVTGPVVASTTSRVGNRSSNWVCPPKKDWSTSDQ